MTVVTNHFRGKAYGHLKQASTIMQRLPKDEQKKMIDRVFGALDDDPIPKSPTSFRWTSPAGVTYSVALCYGVDWQLRIMKNKNKFATYVGQLNDITVADLEKKALILEAEMRELGYIE